MFTLILWSMDVPRRTIYISEHTEARVRDMAEEGESFSAAASRLIEAGADALGDDGGLTFIGSWDGPEEELGLKAEEVLAELAREWRD
jgi:hypothetical protein